MKKYIILLLTLISTTVFGDPILIGPQEYITSNIVYSIINGLVDEGGIIRNGIDHRLSIEPVMTDETIFYFNTGEVIKTNIIDTITRQDVINVIGQTSSSWTNLTKVIIGYNVNTISNQTFYSFPNLNTVVMHNGIHTIADQAFEFCANLRNVYTSGDAGEIRDASVENRIILPTSLTNLYRGAFYGSAITGKLILPESIKWDDDGIRNHYSSIFGYCTNLTSVELPQNLTIIPSSTFYHSGLKTVPTFPNTLTNIKSSAFAYCKDMEGELKLPGSIKTITSSAFQDCEKLSGITFLSGGICSIGSWAFSGCTGIDNNLLNLPTTLTNLGAAAFSKTNIKGVQIPYSLRNINYSTFEDCKNLSWVNFQSVDDSKVMVDYQAFANCSALSNLGNFNIITNIGHHAFANCTSLENLTIPNCMEFIDESAFANCTSLKEVTYDANNDSEDLSIKKWTFQNCTGLTNVVINANNIETIGHEAFISCTSLKSIDFPDNLKTLGYGAFRNCTSLEELNFPNTVTNIIGTCFYNCKGLTNTLTLPRDLASLGDSSFANCTGITNVIFNDNLKDLSGSAFKGCSGICEPIVITDNVGFVGGSCFQGCANIPSVTIGTSVTNINNYSFEGCSKMSEFIFTDPSSVINIRTAAVANAGVSNIIFPNSLRKIEKSAFESCGKLTNVVLNIGLEILEDQAFYNCDNLKDITVPASVTNIGLRTFSNCNTMTNITVDSESEYFADFDGVLFDKNFYQLIQYPSGVSDLDKINYSITNTVGEIGPHAFAYNLNLLSVNFDERDEEESPENIKIGDYAFIECRNLKKFNSENNWEVVIPANVSEIGYSPFYNCRKLNTITVDEDNPIFFDDNGILCQSTVEGEKEANIIIECAYSNNVGSYTFANTVSNIGPYAFAENLFLTSISFDNGENAKPITIGQRAFENCKNVETLEFNSRQIDDIDVYAFAVLKKIKDVELPSSLTILKNGVFQEAGLTNIVIPNGVTNVKYYTFGWCTSLTNVTLPNTLETIDQYAFYNCTNLEAITIPKSVNSIGQHAFRNNYNLKTLIFEQKDDGTTLRIGLDPYTEGNSFFGCSNLESVVINTNTDLGVNTFLNCSSLTNLVFAEMKLEDVKKKSNYPWGLDPDCIKGGIEPDPDDRAIVLRAYAIKNDDETIEDIVIKTLIKIIESGGLDYNGKKYMFIEIEDK